LRGSTVWLTDRTSPSLSGLFRTTPGWLSAIGYSAALERDAAAAQFSLANRRTDLTQALLKGALKTIGIIASTGFRESLINPLMNRLVVVIEKLQSFRRVCHLPGYVCREGSASIECMLDSRLMALQRKFAPADERISPEETSAPNRAEIFLAGIKNQSLVSAHQTKSAEDHQRYEKQTESGQEPNRRRSSSRFCVGQSSQCLGQNQR
jgi:hypothetical protein